MRLNFHTYLHGEPHQPVSFPFQKKIVRPEEDSPKVFSTYSYTCMVKVVAFVAVYELKDVAENQEFIKLEDPCKAGLKTK